jgi:hypothetical protein
MRLPYVTGVGVSGIDVADVNLFMYQFDCLRFKKGRGAATNAPKKAQ